jgi:hypothetical protein
VIGKVTVLNRNEEDSKYEGPPVIEPRTPYHINYEPRMADPELPKLKRAGQKLKFVQQDMFSYIADPFMGRVDLFNYKTAYFLKRNLRHYSHSIGHTLHHIWDELKKVG